MTKEKKDKNKSKAQKHHEDAAEATVLVAVVEGEEESAPNDAEAAEEEAAELPGIFTPQLEGEYGAAFGDEILTAAFMQQAFLAQLPPGSLFPHSGQVRLTEQGLDFEGLVTIPFNEILSVHIHVDRVYHRYYAGLAALSVRGGQSHHLSGAEPLVINFREGEQARNLYALLDWSFFLALSKDKNWRKVVGGVLPAKDKKK